MGHVYEIHSYAIRFYSDDENGNVKAIYEYAIRRYNGDGCSMEKKKDAKYFRKAANTDAMNDCAWMLMKDNGIKKNRKKES